MSKKPPLTNFTILKKSRKRRKAGELFTYKIGEYYYFGRVICTDAFVGPFPNCKLLYFYSDSSESKMSIPALSKNSLLIPPLMTNDRVWHDGYFETIESPKLLPTDHWPRHCFLADNKKYYDEYNQEMSSPISGVPVGEYSLRGYFTIEDEICKALGIPTVSHGDIGDPGLGTSGVQAFDNDDARDWLAELLDNNDVSLIEKAFAAVEKEKDDYIERETANMAVAAAELVVLSRGGRTPGTPKDAVIWWRKTGFKADDGLLKKAKTAIKTIMEKSEIKELWEASEYYDEWLKYIKGLIRRLK